MLRTTVDGPATACIGGGTAGRSTGAAVIGLRIGTLRGFTVRAAAGTASTGGFKTRNLDLGFEGASVGMMNAAGFFVVTVRTELASLEEEANVFLKSAKLGSETGFCGLGLATVKPSRRGRFAGLGS